MDFIKWMSVASLCVACGAHQSTQNHFTKSGQEQSTETTKDPLVKMEQALFDGETKTFFQIFETEKFNVHLKLKSGRSLLAEACFYKRTAIIRGLRQRGALIENSPMGSDDLLSWTQAQPEAAKLLRALQKTDQEDQMDLMSELEKNDFRKIKELIKQDVAINFISENGETPLTFSIKKQGMNALRVLLAEADLDVNLKNRQQESPLGLSRQFNLKSVEKELLKRNAVDEIGGTHD